MQRAGLGQMAQQLANEQWVPLRLLVQQLDEPGRGLLGAALHQRGHGHLVQSRQRDPMMRRHRRQIPQQVA